MIEKNFKKCVISTSRFNDVHPKMVNMKFTNLPRLKFLTRLASAAKAVRAEDIADVKEFEKICELASEVDEQGNVTRRASEARRALENPQMVSTPMKRAVEAKRKKALKYGERANKLFADASVALGLAIQAEHELAVFEAAQPLPDNRKRNGLSQSKDEDVQFFLDWCAEQEIPPYVFRRLTIAERDIIARLILDARDDPNYERSDNVWPLLWKAGLLTAPKSEVTADQSALLAAAWDRYKGSDSRLRDQLEHRIGRKLDISEGFAASLEAIARRASELGQVEARIFYCAAHEQMSHDAEIIGQILGADLAGKKRIEAAIQSIIATSNIAWRCEDDDLAKAVASLVAAIKECHQRQHDVGFWPELILNGYVAEESAVSKYVDDPREFWALFALALKLSGLDLRYPFGTMPELQGDDQTDDDVPFSDDPFNRVWEFRSQNAKVAARSKLADRVEDPAETHHAVVAKDGTAEIEPDNGSPEPAISRSQSNELIIWRDPNSAEPKPQMPTEQPAPSLNNSQPISPSARPSRQEGFE